MERCSNYIQDRRQGVFFILKTIGSCFFFLFLVVPILGVVPVEPFLVEFDHDLRNLHVGLFGWYQVSLIRALPLDEEEKLSRVIGCPDDPFCCKTACKAPWFVVILVFSFLLLLRLFLLGSF